jgi:hypothetical protein
VVGKIFNITPQNRVSIAEQLHALDVGQIFLSAIQPTPEATTTWWLAHFSLKR